MPLSTWPIFVYFLILFLLAWPLGIHIAQTLGEEAAPRATRWLAPLEKAIYRLVGIKPREELTAHAYLRDLLVFNLIGFLATFLILLMQGSLPWNPQKFPGLPWHLAFNTAVSFTTNTNWQSYSGESTLSYFSQMIGLTTQNFVSAATGMAVIAALVRGLTRKVDGRLGSFATDLVRFTVHVLLPLSLLWAILLASQGVIQNLSPYVTATTLEGTPQTLPMGPVASQVAIKQLGTNGGGFFGVNSAHPFENPTPFSNFLQTLAILLLPLAQILAFGRMLKRPREGHALLTSMLLLFIPLLCLALWSEHQGVPGLGASLEGKEVRFGVTESVLWGITTTAASNGSVNAMHSSFTPLAGLAFLFQILTGEVVFGGVGAGLYGMALYVLLTVFLAGLMVGRSPEWLGKKIEALEVKWALVALLVPSALILLGTSLAAVSAWGTSALSHAGPHGLSELLYAFASTLGNNGSAFAGFAAGGTTLNIVLGICMVLGRFLVIIPVVLIAGSLGRKKTVPISAGTFPTDHPLFSGLLASVIVIFGALTFFPVLALGPLVEHFLMMAGQTF